MGRCRPRKCSTTREVIRTFTLDTKASPSPAGNTVQVAPAKGNPDNTMQGVATLDPTKKQARIVLGGGPDGPANVEVKNVDRAVFGAVVHATVEQDRWSGMSGAAAQPTRILDADVPLS